MAHPRARVSEETSLAIPVRVKDRIMATVTVRYAATAVPLRAAMEQILPKMREVAQSRSKQGFAQKVLTLRLRQPARGSLAISA